MAWWDYAKKEEWFDKVSKILFFTDGYPCAAWGPEHGPEKTVWVVKGSKKVGPFGTTIHLDEI